MVVYTGNPSNNKPAIKSSKSLTTVDSEGFNIKPYVDNGLRYPLDVLRFNKAPKTQTVCQTQKSIFC
jgi:hypothetical protein